VPPTHSIDITAREFYLDKAAAREPDKCVRSGKQPHSP